MCLHLVLIALALHQIMAEVSLMLVYSFTFFLGQAFPKAPFAKLRLTALCPL